jgi:hypothetical protein
MVALRELAERLAGEPLHLEQLPPTEHLLGDWQASTIDGRIVACGRGNAADALSEVVMLVREEKDLSETAL